MRITVKKIELFYEPRKEALKRIEAVENEPEMSEFDSAFLCGMIKKKMPRKIVEVGVAAGGTTAIIAECLKELNLGDVCEFYSVDLNAFYYRDGTRTTGFLAQPCLETGLKHKFLLGKYLPEFLEEIGEDIDIIIIDTVHILPGEILDFLAAFPFLSSDAYVVLHDIGYNCLGGMKEGYATKFVYDLVVADKFFNEDNSNNENMPNIAGFVLTEETGKHLENLFSALSITWAYYPSVEELQIYREHYKKYYSDIFVNHFERAVVLQRQIQEREQNRPINKMSLKARIRRAARMMIKGY